MLTKLYIKDLRVLLADKKGLMIFILMPIVLTAILSFALSGSFGDPGKMDAISVAVVKHYDYDAEVIAFEKIALQSMGAGQEGIDIGLIKESLDVESMFFDTFLGHEDLLRIMKVSVMTDAEAAKALEAGTVAVVVTLPKGFIVDQYVNFLLPINNPMVINLAQHPDYDYSSQIVKSIFDSYFDTLNKRFVNKNVFLEVGPTYLDRDMIFGNLEAVMSQDIEDAIQTHVVIDTIPGKRLINSFTYYSIAMMAMFILYSASYMGRELLSEKKMLTLDRGVVAGIHYGRVLTAKFLMTVTLCYLQMGILILFATFVLGVAWENPIKIMVAIAFSAIAVSGLGIFISAITLTAENYRIANIFENLLIHIFALIGGSYIPLEVLPKLFMTLKYFALNGIVLDLFINTYQDASWQQLGLYYLLLSAIAIVFSTIAAIIIIRKEATSYEGTAKA